MALNFDDYKCEDCKTVWTFTKEARHHEFPKSPPCPKCNSKNTHRVWGAPLIHVSRGKDGNSKDGYTGSSGTPKGSKEQETLRKINNSKNPIITGG